MPIEVSASASYQVDGSISTSNPEICAKVFSEYQLEGPNNPYMEVDIQNGKMLVAISEFEVWIDFEYTSLPVT
ncbi:MAG: hypothetical protein ACTSUE_12225 [Promethearchaeota archaeon]